MMITKRYEITTLSCSPLGMPDASKRARSWIANAVAGRLLGIWQSDIGTIGQLIILREFDTEEQLGNERNRALKDTDPFGSSSGGTPISMDSFAPFPFLPPIKAHDYGGTFEIRTYFQKPGGLPGTMAAWRDAIEPAREYTDHLVTNLYALDGEPRITHIWGFDSVEQRNELRDKHYAANLWPPKGGPERIARATSTIAKSEPGLPIV